MVKSKEATRQRALDAATRVFIERGYDGATLREIALAAGITEMTLLRHFGTKDNILREALLERAPELPDEERRLPEDLDEAVRTVSKGIWKGMMGERRALLKTLIGESVRRPEYNRAMAHVPREFVRTFGKFIEIKQEQGVVKDGDPQLIALSLLGMFFGIAMGGGFMEDVLHHEPDEIIDTFVSIFAQGIKKVQE